KSAHCLNEFNLLIAIDFMTEELDEGLQGVVVNRLISAPNRFDDCVMCQNPSRISHEKLKKRVLFSSQHDLAFTSRDTVSRRVQDEIGGFQLRPLNNRPPSRYRP